VCSVLNIGIKGCRFYVLSDYICSMFECGKPGIIKNTTEKYMSSNQ
jgi:hypothetical protein